MAVNQTRSARGVLAKIRFLVNGAAATMSSDSRPDCPVKTVKLAYRYNALRGSDSDVRCDFKL